MQEAKLFEKLDKIIELIGDIKKVQALVDFIPSVGPFGNIPFHNHGSWCENGKTCYDKRDRITIKKPDNEKYKCKKHGVIHKNGGYPSCCICACHIEGIINDCFYIKKGICESCGGKSFHSPESK